ncbi:MAG: type II toxin-antitoxin system RelE/ParE family toxin [Thermodesulfobacteriota bacterium]|nr:type II toxin-antitoxin system RelE/ParE family toxin [Thermodesulfobacteriota bacterium]
MKYQLEIMPKAARDIKTIPKKDVVKIIEKINEMMDGLKGDVKRLTNFTPEYRLRYRNWRVLFEVEDDRIIIYRIMHRKDIYRLGG